MIQLERINEQRVLACREKDPSMKAATIARELGISREAVRIHLKNNGLLTNLYFPKLCEDCGVKINSNSVRCKKCSSLFRKTEVTCGTCGEYFSIPKSQYRRSMSSLKYKGNFYHDRECFYKRPRK